MAQAFAATSAGTGEYAAKQRDLVYRSFGTTGLVVSEDGFGGYRVDISVAEHRQALEYALRSGIIKIYEAQRAQEGKGDKMQMLYDYLTGNEFRGQVEAIVEGFMAMKNSISRERVQMEKMWKEREKRLNRSIAIQTLNSF